MLRVILGLVLSVCALAHELQENRATLVLRDSTHLSMSLYVDFAPLLHNALAPQLEFGPFLLMYSSMSMEALGQELLRAQARIEASVRVVVPGPDGGTLLRLSGWKWPDAKQVQALLQRKVMQAVVEGGHAHDAPTEIHAETVSDREIGSVTVQFPRAFGKVLVVSYRPRQVWVEDQVSPEIRF